MKGQMKLLRVLQTGEFERLGSNRTQKCDVRILSATNANLKSDIDKGTFREDLFFRLAVIELHVPALRERPDDILPIAEAFLPKFPATDGSLRTLGAAAREALVDHDWPGNVRELQNRIQRASLVSTSSELSPSDLGLDETSERREDDSSADLEDGSRSDEAVEIEEALSRARGVISRAAAELGMSRQALYRRMARLGISVERRTTAR